MQANVKYLRPLPDPPKELESLFREHYNQVFRTAYKITGSVSDAEDVLQTVFLRLAGRKEGFDLSPSPGSYLHRAAINASLDIVRHHSKSKSVALEEITENTDLNPEAQHADNELRWRVRQSVASLGARAAEIVALKYFEGYGNREIAKMLGTSQMVVAVVLHRARGRLRNEIGKFLEA